MALSKKHYQETADIIAAARTEFATTLGVVTVLDFVTAHLADMFTEDNPAFDRARFYQACGYRDPEDET